VHKFNNLKSFYHFLKNILARSIAFYPPLRNEIMQCVLPTAFIFFCFWGSLSLTDGFQKSQKTCINCTKLRIQCPKIVSEGRAAEKGGRRENGGIEPWLLGDRRPWLSPTHSSSSRTGAAK